MVPAFVSESSSPVQLREVLQSPDRMTAPSAPAPASRFDLAIEFLLYALLAFAPAAMGVVHPWSELVFVALAATMANCLAIKLLRKPAERFIWSWSYLPAALFVLLALIQLIPLSHHLAATLAPRGAAMRSDLLSDLPAASSSLKHLTLSFYALATRHALWLILSYATIFVVVANVFQRREQIRRLLTAVTLIGAAVIVLALVQDLFGTNRIYFTWLTPAIAATSGPFVNHSHFSQFVNLSIGCAIGLMLVRLREMSSLGRFMPRSIFECLHLPEFRIVWLGGFVILAGTAAVFLSMSRGGMVSSLCATIFVALALGHHRKMRPHGWMMMLLALVTTTGLCYVAFDTAYNRWFNPQHAVSIKDRWGPTPSFCRCSTTRTRPRSRPTLTMTMPRR